MNEFVPLTLPLTIGTDVAGVVADVGEGVAEVAAGDSVYGAAGVVMGGSGAFADQAVTSAGLLGAAPASVDLAVAGALPLAGVAALQAITETLDVQPGARVLVHGASGGVGLVAVILARHLGGHVVATVHGNGEAVMNEFEVDEVVNTDTTDLSSLQRFDLTLDLVGNDPVLPVQVTKPGGRVVGLRIPPDQQAAADQGITAILQATEVTAERLNRLREHVDEGLVAPYVAQTFELSDVSRAFRTKERGGVPGKIAVAVTTRSPADRAANG